MDQSAKLVRSLNPCGYGPTPRTTVSRTEKPESRCVLGRCLVSLPGRETDCDDGPRRTPSPHRLGVPDAKTRELRGISIRVGTVPVVSTPSI